MTLCGYPHVARVSTGIHDPLLASALMLEHAGTRLLMVALDLLFLSPPTARNIRKRVAAALQMPEEGVFISCTHTHSGPVTCLMPGCQNDPAMPPPEPAYLSWVADQVVAAAREATAQPVAAELAWTRADARGVGGNRLAPNGVTDPECGILAVRNAQTKAILAVSLIYGMHPTVLHEDSTLVSSDFPHYARLHLRECLGDNVMVLYHTAPCGNQSPRYFVTGQTFAEAERLGRKLGAAAAAALLGGIRTAEWNPTPTLAAALTRVELPRRTLPQPAAARALLKEYRDRYAQLQAEGAPHPTVRTAECAVFGAEESVALAEAEAGGVLARMIAEYAPLEVQVLRIGDVAVAGLPGECFVEYGLAIKQGTARRTFVVSLVNGELLGYIVTPEAAAAGGYEATNAVFAPEAGAVLTRTAIGLVERVCT
jgi:hypothetical protein